MGISNSWSTRKLGKARATVRLWQVRWAEAIPALVVAEQRRETHYVEVELAGTKTRGQTTVDWFDRASEAPNVELVLELDTQRVWQMMKAALSTD